MDYRHTPSGKKLPLFLLKKWRKQERDTDTASASSLERDTDSQSIGASYGGQADRIFSTGEIEDRLRRTAAAVYNLQKQIYRGEELYYEDTMPHRNVCKGGLEGFVDAKDAGSGDSGFMRGLHQNIRKVPGDVRWFSESNVSKEEMHRHSLDIVLAASAKKPTTDASDRDLASNKRTHSSDTIPLSESEMNIDAPLATRREVGATDPKRKRDDAEEHGPKISSARRSRTEGFKHAQSSSAAKVKEDYSGGNSESLPPRDDDTDNKNDISSTNTSSGVPVKKDDSKKVDSQRRRRSRRGAKP